jgi:hypothetical protein
MTKLNIDALLQIGWMLEELKEEFRITYITEFRQSDLK